MNLTMDNTCYLLRQKIEKLESGKEFQKLVKENEILSQRVKRQKNTLENKTQIIDTKNRVNNDLRHKISVLRDQRDEYHDLSVAQKKIIKEQKEEIAYSQKRYLKAEELLKQSTEQNASDQAQISDQAKKIAELQNQIYKLQIMLRTDSSNSGKTSASDSEASRAKRHKSRSRNTGNGRKAAGRKLGGQPGHKGHPRSKPAGSVLSGPEIECPEPKEVLEHLDQWKKTGRTRTHLVYGITLMVNASCYVSDQWINKKTGKKIYSPFPEEAANEVNYGPSIKAAAALLNNYCNVSVRKTSEFFSELSNGAIQLSAGWVSGLKHEFSVKSKADREEIFKALLAGSYLNADTTFTRVNGRQAYIHLSANPENVLYQARKNKGEKAVANTPVELYQGPVVSDSESIYWKYGTAHQTCLIHELRYCRRIRENEPKSDWAADMEKFLTGLIDSYNTRGIPGPEKVKELEAEFDSILEKGIRQYPKPKELVWREGYNTVRRLKKHKDAVFYFLKHPGVPFHNNHCEQLARQAKRKTRQCDQFRSRKGLSDYCDLQSVLQTERLRKRNLHRKAMEVFSRQKKKK